MSNFWTRGPQQATPSPQQPVQPPAVPQPWWAPRSLVQPVQAPQQMVSPSPADDGQKSNLGALLHQDQYTTTKAISNTIGSTHCPSCGGGNYMAPFGMPNAISQCADCGYNPRFLHSTHGVGVSDIGQTGPPRVARGQNNRPVDALPMMSVVAHV